MNILSKRIAATAVVFGLALGGVLVATTGASGHTTGISGAATCLSDGSAKVDWTVTNDYGLVETITASDNTAIPVGSTIDAKTGDTNTFKVFTQTVPAPAGGVVINTTITATWSDEYTQIKPAVVVVPATCVLSNLKDALAAVNVAAPSCTTDGAASYTGSANVTWNPETVDTTVGSHTAVATAVAKHTFADGSTIQNFNYTVLPQDPTLCAVVMQCEVPNAPTVITNLSSLYLGDTRTGGSNALIPGGIHITTFGSILSQAKAAGYVYFITPLLFNRAGTPAIDYTTTSGASAGLQLTVNVDGHFFGNLVYEPLFSEYWTSHLVTGLPAGPNPSYQKAYGTLNDYAQAWEAHGHTATIVAVGYSLGSGAIGDGVVHSLTVGCDKYVFGLPATPAARVFDVPSNTEVTCTTTGGGSYVTTNVHHSVVQVWSEASQTFIDGEDTITITRTKVAVGTEVCPIHISTPVVFPTQTDLCGTTQDGRGVANNTDAYTITTVTNPDGSADYTAKANAGYVFKEGVVLTAHLEALTDVPCPLNLPPTTVATLAHTGVEIYDWLAVAGLLLLLGVGVIAAKRKFAKK